MQRFILISLWLAVVVSAGFGAHRAAAQCPMIPDATCKFSFASGFAYSDSGDDTKDKLSFKFLKGSYSSVAELGNPTSTTTYFLCIYEDGALSHTLSVAPDADCADDACWVAKPNGFSFKDKLGSQSGVTSIKLTTPGEVVNKTTAGLKGKGLALPDLALPLVEPIAVQLRNSNDQCWGGLYNGEGQVDQKPTRGKMKTRGKLAALPSCTDGIANGYEAGVDCGRGCPTGCAFSSSCLDDTDCASGMCDNGACSSKRMFVTSTGHDGNFGGLAAGDAICNTRAATAGLGGTWVAWLSTSSVDAIDRITDQPYRLLDGTLAFANKAQISSTGLPSNALALTEFGAASANNPWTGTNDTGALALPNCDNWTNVSAMGVVGRPSTPSDWSSFGTGGCSSAHPLYCFEQ